MNISNLSANVSSTSVDANSSAMFVASVPQQGVADFADFKFEATLDFEIEKNVPQQSAVEADAEAEFVRHDLPVPVVLAEVEAPVVGVNGAGGAAAAQLGGFDSVAQSSEVPLRELGELAGRSLRSQSAGNLGAGEGRGLRGATAAGAAVDAQSSEVPLRELDELAGRSLRSQSALGLTAVESGNPNLASRATTVVADVAKLAGEGGGHSSTLISSSLDRGLSNLEVSPTERSHASTSISSLSLPSAAAPLRGLPAVVSTARVADLNLVQGRGLSLRQAAQATHGPVRTLGGVVSEPVSLEAVERSLGHPHARTVVPLASIGAGFQQAGQQFSNRSFEERDPREAAAKKAQARATDAVIDASSSSLNVAAKGATSPSAASVTGGQVMQRLIESIEVLAQQTRRKEISFSLDLERGKQLRVNLRIVGDHVKSVFVTDSDSLRQAIRDNWEQLQRQINAQGLQAEVPDFGDALSGGQFKQSEQQEQLEQQKLQADQLRGKVLREVQAPVASHSSPSITLTDAAVIRYA